MRQPIEKAIDWVIDQGVKAVNKVDKDKNKGKGSKPSDETSAGQDNAPIEISVHKDRRVSERLSRTIEGEG
ncbi:hypothetical protein F7734_38200 [Scytonema sp. UIC 10036]|uniref:hypothetical protein n=1 Tax=Scytonema sp. UIC 10036 TaxID=2304196 RepID=UPI0012DAB192|nr:hypothetical protein [Scytonema sp. UIC 10036]MUG97833.1 hypothetical protein [Scytonema sp. UIC 10036]